MVYKNLQLVINLGGIMETCLQCRTPGFIPGLGRSPGEGNGNALQYSCLENPMDRGAWQATVHRVTKSWTRLSNFTSRTKKDFHYNAEYLPQGSKLH